jgi:hypothetical protein
LAQQALEDGELAAHGQQDGKDRLYDRRQHRLSRNPLAHRRVEPGLGRPSSRARKVSLTRAG